VVTQLPGQQRLILLVEDDEQLRNTVARTLRASGYMVYAAGDFRQALNGMAIKPHLLILDITLPDATGWDVANWLEEQTSPVPIIVISGMAPDPDRIDQFKPKAFLGKPFGMRELLNLVEKYAGRAR
jgi:DNA-binding response OmpR family regulator